VPKSGLDEEIPAKAEHVPLQRPLRDIKKEASMGSRGATNGIGPYIECSVPASVASKICIEWEKVEANNEFKAGCGDRGETRPETVKTVRVVAKRSPEIYTTVKTPLEKVAFAAGIEPE